jgi:hypothetical protein
MTASRAAAGTPSATQGRPPCPMTAAADSVASADKERRATGR